LYREYTDALAGGPALDAYLKKWPIDFMLITYGADRSPAFFKYLDDSGEWKNVYFDERSIVYVRNIPRFQGVIERAAYRLIHAATPGQQEIRAEDAVQWLAEAERAAAAAPTSWTPLQYKSKALIALGRLDEAETTSRRILELAPEAFFAWGDLGFIY